MQRRFSSISLRNNVADFAEKVNEQLQSWTDDGWELEHVTEGGEAHKIAGLTVYSFFWRKD